jgi:hypothetical protein
MVFETVGRAACSWIALLPALAGCASARPEIATRTATRAAPASTPAALPTGTPDASPTPNPGADATSDDDDLALRPGSDFVRGIAEKGTEPEPTDAATTARELEEGLRNGEVFRQVLVGAIAFPSRRLTWVRSQDDRRVELTLFCQTQRGSGVPWLHLDGREQLESTWSTPVRTTFRGPRRADGEPLRLSTTDDLGPLWACVKVVRSLIMTCRPSVVPVLRAGARLLGDHAHPPIRWQPAAREYVHGESCLLARDPADPKGARTEAVIVMRSDEPLFFAGPPRAGHAGRPSGVEWAFDNSDQVVQEGAFRWVRRGD